MNVTPAVHTALTEAMDRLLTGEPQHSDGSLTVGECHELVTQGLSAPPVGEKIW